MNQLWLPLEFNQPDLHLWSLNVIALIRHENEKTIVDEWLRGFRFRPISNLMEEW